MRRRSVKQNSWIKVDTEHAKAVYGVREKISFRIYLSAEAPLKPSAWLWVMTLDGASELGSGVVPAGSGATVEGQLDQPGVIRITVTPDIGKEQLGIGVASAVVEPYRIQPTAVRPADFIDFWKMQQEKLAKVPMDPCLREAAPTQPGLEIFDLSLGNVDGIRARGYFGKPLRKSSLPAIITLAGMGVRSASIGAVTRLAKRGFLAIDVTNHDIPNGKSLEFYRKIGFEGLFSYPLQGREDRQSYYYRKILLGVLRMVDFLASCPDWNGRSLTVSGFSEGGGLAMMAAALDPRITGVLANVPTLGEQSGIAFARPTANPRLVRLNRDGTPDAKLMQVASYYDTCNFAGLIKAFVLMNVGLIDTSSPPMTCLSAYNLIPGPKNICLGHLRGHEASPQFAKLVNEYLERQTAEISSSEKKRIPEYYERIRRTHFRRNSRSSPRIHL